MLQDTKKNIFCLTWIRFSNPITGGKKNFVRRKQNKNKQNIFRIFLIDMKLIYNSNDNPVD